MRPLRIATAILLGWALGMPTSGQTAEEQGRRSTTPNVEVQNQRPTEGTIEMPVYKPPKRSAPKGRVGGGIRGGDGPAIYVLAPDHVGFTKDEQPSLFWYLSKPTSLPLEFTLIDSRSVKPILETKLKSPTQPGVQRISLKDLRVKIEPSVQYKWYVTLLVGPESSSRDVVAGGIIERMTIIEVHFLCPGANGDTVVWYANCGLWYDAIAVISEMIEKAPVDRTLRKQRACLLMQVGLWEVARADYPEIKVQDCPDSAHGLN